MTAHSRDAWIVEGNTMVDRLFAIGLALAYEGDEAANAHVLEARDGIDCLIRDLRTTTFNDGERTDTRVQIDLDRLSIGLDGLRSARPAEGMVAHEAAVRAVGRATVALIEVQIAN